MQKWTLEQITDASGHWVVFKLLCHGFFVLCGCFDHIFPKHFVFVGKCVSTSAKRPTASHSHQLLHLFLQLRMWNP